MLLIYEVVNGCVSISFQDIEETLYHNNFTSVNVIFCGDVGIPEQDRLAFAIYQFIAMFAAPTIIMTFCYARVIYVLWISSKRLKEMTDPDGYVSSIPFLLEEVICFNLIVTHSHPSINMSSRFKLCLTVTIGTAVFPE